VGHSFSVYGPLLLGCTSLLYEGKPVGTPDEANFWRVIERHRVNALFTAPTALRAIKRLDEDGLRPSEFDLTSLRTLFLAGERADPDTLRWSPTTCIEGRLSLPHSFAFDRAEHALKVPVRDHWWQTETGLHNLPCVWSN
jgi:propionyl-CoA synthetase